MAARGSRYGDVHQFVYYKHQPLSGHETRSIRPYAAFLTSVGVSWRGCAMICACCVVSEFVWLSKAGDTAERLLIGSGPHGNDPTSSLEIDLLLRYLCDLLHLSHLHCVSCSSVLPVTCNVWMTVSCRRCLAKLSTRAVKDCTTHDNIRPRLPLEWKTFL